MSLETTGQHRVAGGTLRYCRHASTATGTAMRFSLFLPKGAGPFPLLLWLSGLTCTEENFTTKAGAYLPASRLGLAVLAPDTSPRGEGVADDAAYDLGQGASFYVDATVAPWAAHFQMERYITTELLPLVAREFPVDAARCGISGHSMGGHGALTLALRHPRLFRSVSAFSPIGSPTRCPWGHKALGAYLGPDESRWREHDASLLIEAGAARGHFDQILVDQGSADSFLEAQLKPELLESACAKAGQALQLRRQEGYDHSYFFVSTFIESHLSWHAERIR
ncbi:MAG TPA: S-formylglutathione hydrolase [Steroidobacteraceae bacterium]|nr:S-formylglutathione hydrolase [Steroidobacteraceae bacterium]